MAKGQLLKPEQIVTLLRQIDVLTSNGKTLAQACKGWARWSKATIAGARSMAV